MNNVLYFYLTLLVVKTSDEINDISISFSQIEYCLRKIRSIKASNQNETFSTILPCLQMDSGLFHLQLDRPGWLLKPVGPIYQFPSPCLFIKYPPQTLNNRLNSKITKKKQLITGSLHVLGK